MNYKNSNKYKTNSFIQPLLTQLKLLGIKFTQAETKVTLDKLFENQIPQNILSHLRT